jgi:membrane-anchored protein YejM (alkaline phosphatase superfamily)
METASVAQIKKELKSLSKEDLLEHCLRVAKYKKENKELLSYLLFEAHDEQQYIEDIKEEIALDFARILDLNTYYIKKSVRKILRNVNKKSKYSGIKTTEVELLIFFCEKMKERGFNSMKHMVLLNIYDRQLEKTRKLISGLHEDLQYDYHSMLESL